MGTELLLNYWIHGDKVEIGPNCLSHDYLCPMTIWSLIKRSHCLPDWSKNADEERLDQLGDDCFLFTSLSSQFILLSPFQSSPLSYKMCFLRMADAHYYREGDQHRVRGFVHSSFSYCLRMSVENAPHHRHTQTHTETHTHTFHASGYSYRQESDFRGEKKSP